MKIAARARRVDQLLGKTATAGAVHTYNDTAGCFSQSHCPSVGAEEDFSHFLLILLTLRGREQQDSVLLGGWKRLFAQPDDLVHPLWLVSALRS